MWIDEQTKQWINGARQYVSIRAENKNAPLLLYLHGGPGDSALPLVLHYQKALEKHFTVVVWEQRGAGKSYYRFRQDEKIIIDTYMQDLYQLTKMLLKRFHQDKLYLVGHSWGSVLGLRFIQQYPELVQIYVGCGQVVNMKKSCRNAYDFALATAGPGVAKKLKEIDPAYSGESWMKNLLFVTKQVVKNKGSLYGKRSYSSLVKPFIFSKYYSLFDLIRRMIGGVQSIRYLWRELMQIDFEQCLQFEVPVVLIEGRHDHHVSSVLAKAYFDQIQSEKQFYWFEQSCHFPQWSESERFNQLMIGFLEK